MDERFTFSEHDYQRKIRFKLTGLEIQRHGINLKLVFAVLMLIATA